MLRDDAPDNSGGRNKLTIRLALDFISDFSRKLNADVGLLLIHI
jgi:hypothetical protein